MAESGWRSISGACACGTAQTTARKTHARAALTSVIRRTLEAPDTFDKNGWLQIGLSGHQPRMAEKYISTGSLYMASLALLPLGLPATDTFWTAAHTPGTWENAWGGVNIPADSALRGEHGDRWKARQ